MGLSTSPIVSGFLSSVVTTITLLLVALMGLEKHTPYIPKLNKSWPVAVFLLGTSVFVIPGIYVRENGFLSSNDLGNRSQPSGLLSASLSAESCGELLLIPYDEAAIRLRGLSSVPKDVVIDLALSLTTEEEFEHKKSSVCSL